MPMRHRPQSPMHPGMGPRMMPQGFYGGMPYQNYGPPTQMGRPMMGRNQGNRGQGGLLSKLLGRGNQQQGGFPGVMQSTGRGILGGGGGGGGGGTGAGGAGGVGGLLKSLANPEGLNGLLNNTQSILKTAQQLGPVFQQYGPLVRNIPSLWKLYKGLTEASSETEASETEEIKTTEVDEDVSSIEINQAMDESPEEQKIQPLESNQSTLLKHKRSVPKLYI